MQCSFHNPGRDSLDIDIDQPSLHTGFRYDGLHLSCDIVEVFVGGGRYLDGLLHD